MPLRPTPDAMRERVFAVLGGEIEGVRVLDLFAGTGAVAFEALSRGAVSAVLVERHRAAAQLIERNRSALGIDPEVAQIMVRPALAALKSLARVGSSFELLWADPPFESWQEGAEAVAEAARLGVLAVAGTACLECPARASLEELPEELEVTRDLKGGASRVLLLRRR
jgi:16S rRNA (guanine966-N2)-methyltransferase